MHLPDLSHETAARARGFRRICGVDEAGRGPLCGPVVAAALWLEPGVAIRFAGLNDSKKLTRPARERLHAAMLDAVADGLVDLAVGIASVAEIDSLNILRASHLAMERAIAALTWPADHLLIDGNLLPRGLAVSAEAIVSGDARSLSIAAASVIAKVERDRIMVDLAQQHPGYGWEHNAGYPTAEHLAALKQLGVTPHHRRSFAPVYNILYQEQSLSY